MTASAGVVGWAVEAEIRPGKLEQFRFVTEEMGAVAAVKPGPLVYERYLDESLSVAHFVGRYTDSAAAVTHFQTYRDRFADRLDSVMDRWRAHVYGTVSHELATMPTALQPVFVARVTGFFRYGQALADK